MKITHTVQAGAAGYLTVGAIADFVHQAAEAHVPPEAVVAVRHSEGQRGEPSWTAQITWTEERA